jgi:hypothetical protein
MVVLVTRLNVIKMFKTKRNGTLVTSLHKNWFPVISSEKLAGIIGDLICDGHLQGEPKWRLDFTSKNTFELERFGKEIFKIFQVKGKARPCTSNRFGKTYNYGVNNKMLSRIFYKLGVPYGCKVKQEFLTPRWILNNKEYFRTFCKRAFTCEGCVSVEGASSFIEINMWKADYLKENLIEFFNQIKIRLKNYFDIITTNVFLSSYYNLRKDGIKTIGARLRIKRLNSLINFYNNIGFDDPIKQNKLKQIIIIKGGTV